MPTDTPLDLDVIEAHHRRTWRGDDMVPTCSCGAGVTPCTTARLVAALRKAEAERDEQARFKDAQRADKRKARALLSEWRMRGMRAEAQVAAVLALCDEAAPRRMGDGYLSASVLAPEDVRAAVDGAGVVPMSPDMGHELRERIAQRIDQAWAEAKDRRQKSEYREGYLDGLQHAEAVARITPLTIGVAPLDVEAPQYDRIESRGRKS